MSADWRICARKYKTIFFSKSRGIITLVLLRKSVGVSSCPVEDIWDEGRMEVEWDGEVPVVERHVWVQLNNSDQWKAKNCRSLSGLKSTYDRIHNSPLYLLYYPACRETSIDFISDLGHDRSIDYALIMRKQLIDKVYELRLWSSFCSFR